MGISIHVRTVAVVCAFLAALSITSGLRCLGCRGQTAYQCFVSAITEFCNKGEECRFRMLFHRHIPSRTRAWFEAGCASVAECRAPDSEFYAHFCCRVSYCNYIPVG